MKALILMPSGANPGFLEIFAGVTLHGSFDGDEDEFLDTLQYYESLDGWVVWLTEIVQ